MPYPRRKTFQRWEECDECGFDFPLSQLSRDYTGYLKCSQCWDPKGFEENRADMFLKIEELDEEEYGEEILS